MKPDTRVTVNWRSDWPARVGCTGVVVAPPADYPPPQPREVVVLLDDDPLALEPAPGMPAPRTWTCVLDEWAVDVQAGAS